MHASRHVFEVKAATEESALSFLSERRRRRCRCATSAGFSPLGPSFAFAFLRLLRRSIYRPQSPPLPSSPPLLLGRLLAGIIGEGIKAAKLRVVEEGREREREREEDKGRGREAGMGRRQKERGAGGSGGSGGDVSQTGFLSGLLPHPSIHPSSFRATHK